MVRLALVDLSARGAQPMWSRDRRVAIVFNGEAYNFRHERKRLAAAGYRFDSSTDTETVLALYLERGPSFVEALRGMFALAIVDWRDSRAGNPPRLVLGRDRFGIKPLYFTETSEGMVAFASEIKGLLALGCVAPEIDPDGLASFLAHGFVVQPSSIIRQVRMLEAGCLRIHVPGRAAESIRFGALPPAVSSRESLGQSATRLRAVLDESVGLHGIADAPIGAFLSGGVDSTGVVGLMRQHVPNLQTYSLGWTGGGSRDETAEAEATARRLGCRHTSIRVSGREVAEIMPRFARDLDQPSVDGLNTWLVSRVAAGDVKGVLSGLGGDEWFAGYPVVRLMARYSGGASGAVAGWAGQMARALAAPLGDTRFESRLRNWSSYRSPLALWMRPHSVFFERRVESLLGQRPSHGAQERVLQALAEMADPEGDEGPVRLACRLDLGVYLKSQLLRDTDATSMAHSLEVRVPFVDPEVAAFAMSCDDKYKLGATSGRGSRYGISGAKRVLIESLRDLLPPDIDGRPKRGFWMPLEEWIKGPIRELAMEATSDSVVRRRGLLAPAAVAAVRLRAEGRKPGAAYPELWSLMMLELWCREVLDPAKVRSEESATGA